MNANAIVIFLSYIFSVVGVIANFMIYRQKDRKSLLQKKLFSDIVWCIHYILISAESGAVTCGISICREIVFLNQEHKWAKHKIWIAVFIALNAVALFFTWKSIYSILPGCSAILSIVVFWIGNPNLTRCVQVPISLAFLIYNTIVGSYVGIINELLSLISIFTFKKFSNLKKSRYSK